MKKYRFFLIFAILFLSFFSPHEIYSQEKYIDRQINPLTEQKIFIPYENLTNFLEKQDKGVLIPYSDFLKLWQEAMKKAPEKKEPPPPIDAAIINAEYKGIVKNTVAEFSAKLKISALKKKWAKLFLNSDNIAITAITLNEKTPILNPVNGGLELVLPEKGEYVLDVKFSTKVNTSPGEKFINFKIPSSPLTKVDIIIPGKDLDVKIEPMLSEKNTVVGDNTEFSAFLSPSGTVNIRWLEKSDEKKVGKSLIFSKLLSEVYIKESVYLITTKVALSIMQAKGDSFQMKIPKELSLVKVAGKNIKDWDINEEGLLTVNLYEKIDGSYSFSISTEKYRNFNEAKFDIPEFQVVDAKREEGEIIIKAEDSLRVQVDQKKRVTQIDPKELKGRLHFKDFVSAFKYFQRPYLISLSITKIKPKVTSQQNIFISIHETIIDYQTAILFRIKDAGLFKLKFLIPKNFRIVEVGNDDIVDSYSVDDENGESILNVTLKNKAYGDFLFDISLEADKKDADISLMLPKLKCLDVEKEEGIIALSLRKNLKLSTENIKSLRPISLEEVRMTDERSSMLPSRKMDPDPRNEIAAGYRYSTTDYSCQLNLNKRKTKIVVSINRNIDIQEVGMKINDILNFEVLYAPVSLFKIEFPENIAQDAVITGNNIKEKRLKINNETKKGIWAVELHSPVLNNFQLNVNTEKKFSSVKVGEKNAIEVPTIRALDIFNESGYLSISKSSNLQVEAEEKNLEPIDTKELPSTINRNQSVLAFRYLSHPYTLKLNATKHEYEKVLDTIVNQAHFDIVLSKEGVAKSEGVFRIQNTNRQSLKLIMPEGTDKIYSVFISGKKASISKGSFEEEKIIMLPKNITPGKEFTLRIIYQTKFSKDFGLWGGFKSRNAEIVDVPTSKITWRLYLPREYSYLYLHGSLNLDSPQRRTYQHVNAKMRSKNIISPRRINLNNTGIMQQADESALYGLDIDMIREGRMFSYSKLDNNAYLDVWYVKKNAMFPFNIIIVAISAFYFSHIASKKRKNRLRNILTLIGIVIGVSLFAPQGFKYFMTLIFYGILLSVGGFLLVYLKNKKYRTNTNETIR